MRYERRDKRKSIYIYHLDRHRSLLLFLWILPSSTLLLTILLDDCIFFNDRCGDWEALLSSLQWLVCTSILLIWLMSRGIFLLFTNEQATILGGEGGGGGGGIEEGGGQDDDINDRSNFLFSVVAVVVLVPGSTSLLDFVCYKVCIIFRK